MLNQSSLDDLINFIKLNGNNIFRPTGEGYYQVFCPNCDTVGQERYHGNLMLKELAFKCWKCDDSKSLLKFLLEQGYDNQEVIKELAELTKKSGRNILRINSIKTGIKHNVELTKNLKTGYKEFRDKYPDKYNQFLDYVKFRCGDIDPIKYGISPQFDRFGKLIMNFQSSDGNNVTARYIDNNDTSYLKYKQGGYYYHQGIKDILEYKNIVICEGIIDCINLSNYYLGFKDSFFFAMNNRMYTSALKYLISKYFLLGDYTFNIVFDSDVINLNKAKQDLVSIKHQYNSDCKINFYIPELGAKDVSDLMLIKRI